MRAPARTHGNAHRRHRPAACISVLTDWDGTECNPATSARGISPCFLILSCPAKAGHPVLTSLSLFTGSSAFADDDSLQTFSTASDTPWPTPTHMVASA